MKIADFKDLIYEKFLRDRNNGNLVWKTKDGKIIPLKDLEDNHLDNIINMLSEQSDKEEMFYDALSGFPEKFILKFQGNPRIFSSWEELEHAFYY